MQTFLVKTPDGRSFEVDGENENDAISYLQNALGEQNAPNTAIDDTISAYEQYLNQGNTQGATPQQEDPYLQELLARTKRERGLGETFGSALSRSTTGLGSTITDLIPAAYYTVTGNEQAAKDQLAEAKAKQEEAARLNPPQFKGVEEVTPSTALPFIVEKIGEAIPATGATLGLGLATALAGAPVAGAAAITYLGSFALNTPNELQNLYDKTGKLELPAAAISGGLQSALDILPEIRLAGKIAGPLKAAVTEKLLAKSGMEPSLLKTVAKETGLATVGEGLTGGAQEAISIAAEKIVGENNDLWGSEEFSRILNGAVSEAAGGLAFGPVAGAIDYSRVSGEKAKIDEANRIKEEEESRINAENQRKQELSEYLPELEGHINSLSEQARSPENRGRAGELNYNLRQAQQELDSLYREYNYLNLSPEERGQIETEEVEEEAAFEEPAATVEQNTVQSVLEPLGIAAKELGLKPSAPLRGAVAKKVADYVDEWRVSPDRSFEEAQAADALLDEHPELQTNAILKARQEERDTHLASVEDLTPKKVDRWYQSALEEHGLAPDEINYLDSNKRSWEDLSAARYAIKNAAARAAISEKLKRDFPQYEQAEIDRVSKLTEQQKLDEERARAEAVFKKAQETSYRKEVKETVNNFLRIAKEQQKKLEAARKQAAQEGRLKAEQDTRAGQLISELDRHLNSDLPSLIQAQLDNPSSVETAYALREMQTAISKKQEELNNLSPQGARPTPRPTVVAPPNIAAMQTVGDVLRHAGFPGVAPRIGVDLKAPLRGDAAERVQRFLGEIKPENVKTREQAQRIDALRDHPALTPENIQNTKAEDYEAHIESVADIKNSPQAFKAWRTKLLGGRKLGETPEVDAAVYEDLRRAQAKAETPVQSRIETFIFSTKPLKDIHDAQQTPSGPLAEVRESRAEKVTKNRTPELQAAAEKLKAGEITREDYARLVDKYKPVVPYEQVPAPASNADMEQALDKPKVPKINAPRGMADGTPVKLRLDIPAYDKHNTWVVTVHEGNKPGFKAEAVIGYTSTAVATDVTFGLETEQAALNIAGGKPKGTIATMKGKWRNMAPEKAKARADAAIKDPAWRQIGMDPERHGYFYDRETMQPITRADEVIQIGPLVLGKNVTYSKPDNFLYSRATERGTARPTPDQVRKVIEDRMGVSAANVTIARTPEEAGVGNVKGIHPLTKGAIINGRAYLFTDNMRVGKEFGVFLHEVGDHLGMKKLVGEGNYNFLVSQVQKWADKNDGSLESKIARAAMERIPEGTPVNDELLAYFIEEAVDNYGVNPSEIKDTATPLGAFFRKIVAGIKNILTKLGLPLNDLRSQDIIDLAYGAAKLELREGTVQKETSTLASIKEKGVPLNDNFWKFYGNSKLLSGGKEPIVMYTGTSKDVDFKSFKVPKRGTWFTNDANFASQYAIENESQDLKYEQGRFNKVNTKSRVIPVYLNIENPKVYSDNGKEMYDEIARFGGTGINGYKRGEAILFDILRSQGYDGVVVGGLENPKVAVVLKDAAQIKSVFNKGDWNPKAKDTLLSLSNDKNVSPLGFYSALEYNLSRLPTKSATAAGWKDAIKGLVNKGQVKAEEVEWSGINDWLDLTEGKITREQVQEYLAQGGVQVEETAMGGDPKVSRRLLELENHGEEIGNRLWPKVFIKYGQNSNITQQMNAGVYPVDDVDAAIKPIYIEWIQYVKDWNAAKKESGETKYDIYTLPGGENYREVLLTLPSKKVKGRNYGHWEQDNVLAHIRLDDRTDQDGKRVLFVEEVQSDWGQKGKKEGFAVSLPPLKELSDDVVITKKYNLTIDQREDINDEYHRVSVEASRKNIYFGDQFESFFGKEKGPRFVELNDKFSNFNFTSKINRILNTVPHSEFLEWRKLFREIVPNAFETDPYEFEQKWAAFQGNAFLAYGETKEEAKENALYGINEDRTSPEGILPAPFVTKTEGWVNLALKRIMIMAAQEGYDSVAFSNGKQNADRYNLANHVESIQVLKEGEGYYVTPTDKDGYEFPPEEAKNAAELERIVGVELAKKIVKDFSGKPNDSFTAMQNEDFETYAVYNQNLEQIGPKFDDYNQAADYAKDLLAGRVVPPRVYSGLDLEIGGEGMKTFYDQIIPSALKKLLPKVDGGKLRNLTIDFSGDASNNKEMPWNTTAVRRIIQNGGEVYAVTNYGSEENIRSEQDLQDILEDGEPRGFIYGDKGETLSQLGFDITPEMVSKIEGGLPQFSRAPEVRESRAPSPATITAVNYGTPQARKTVGDYVLGGMDTVMRNTPRWGRDKVGSILGAISNMPTSARGFMYYSVPLPHFADMVEKVNPAAAKNVRKLADVVAERKTRSDQRKEYIQKILTDGKEVFDNYSETQLAKFEEVAHNLSREQIDPWDAANKTHPLVKQFNATPKPLQDIFNQVVAAYRRFGDEYIDHIEKIAGPAFSPAMKMQYKMRMKRIMPYLPLFREGEFWLAYTDKNGESVVRACETELERHQVIRAAQAAGATDIQPFKQLGDINPNNVKPTREFAQIFNLMKAKKVDEAVQAKVYQTLLQMFPAKSIMQQFRPRKGTAGYREDILRNFAVVGSRMADNLTQFEFTKDIDNVYSALDKDFLKSERSGDDISIEMLNELKQREQFLRYPVNNKYANLAASASYNQYLLGNTSSAIMNTTSLVMSTLPNLAGEYGVIKTQRAMAKALGMYAKGGRDNNTSLKIFGRRLSDKTFMGDSAKGKALAKSRPDLKKLYDTAVSRQAIHRSVGLELHDMKESALSEYTGSWVKIKTLLGYLFQNSERMNREISLIAAYQLEKDKLAAEGITGDVAVDRAIDKAIKLVSFTQGVGAPELGSRMLQSNMGKVIGTFKKYPMTQLYMVGTLFNESIKGASPKEKWIARKQLMGVMGIGWAFAGVKGLPLVGAISFLAELLMGDEDEPFDVDKWALESMGNMGWNGLVSDMTGLRISDRAAIGSFFREDKKRLQELGWQWYLAEQTIGAPASIVKNWLEALELFNQGYTEKALERALPLGAANLLKAVNQGVNGIRTKDGVKIADDPSMAELISQGIGFRSERVARMQDVNNIESQITTAVNARRVKILSDLWRFRDDAVKLFEVELEKEMFNESKYVQDHKLKITQQTIRRSMKQRDIKQKEAEEHFGMAPDKRFSEVFQELEETVGK